MYGTRDAAQNWEASCTASMKNLGFRSGASSTGHCYSEERDVWVVVHGDDFTISGEQWQLEKLRKELKKVMGEQAEKAKISIRNVRREANENLKKELKDKKIGEDELKSLEKKIQNLTDSQISELEKKLKEKEKEIMTV